MLDIQGPWSAACERVEFNMVGCRRRRRQRNDDCVPSPLRNRLPKLYKSAISSFFSAIAHHTHNRALTLRRITENYGLLIVELAQNACGKWAKRYSTLSTH